MKYIWILIVVIIVALFAWYYTSPGQYDSFATCINDSGASFYGAFWCGHCNDQKQEFGKSAKILPYIECSTPDGQGQLQVCVDKKIEGYPTWDFATGTRKTGLLSFEELSNMTGCKLPNQ